MYGQNSLRYVYLLVFSSLCLFTQCIICKENPLLCWYLLRSHTQLDAWSPHGYTLSVSVVINLFLDIWDMYLPILYTNLKFVINFPRISLFTCKRQHKWYALFVSYCNNAHSCYGDLCFMLSQINIVAILSFNTFMGCIIVNTWSYVNNY